MDATYKGPVIHDYDFFSLNKLFINRLIRCFSEKPWHSYDVIVRISRRSTISNIRDVCTNDRLFWIRVFGHKWVLDWSKICKPMFQIVERVMNSFAYNIILSHEKKIWYLHTDNLVYLAGRNVMGPLLLTWINFNLSMDEITYPFPTVAPLKFGNG